MANRSTGSKDERPSGRRSRARSSQAHPKLFEELALEALTSLRLAFADFGVTRAQFERAIRRSRREKRVPAASGPFLSDTRGVGRIIEQWSRSPSYIESNGKPRVLPITGAGATFETLARRSLPDMPLTSIIALAQEVAEVRLQPGGKIALLGSIFTSLRSSEERQLAHLVRHLVGLLATGVHNRRNTSSDQDAGLICRIASGVIVSSKLRSLVKEVRPRIYDLLLGMEDSFEARAPSSAGELKKASLVSVSVYLSEEKDLDRAGAWPDVGTPRPLSRGRGEGAAPRQPRIPTRQARSGRYR